MNYKKKLDTIFSQYIRNRDIVKDGFCRCISCGEMKHWKKMDAGHYINRKHLSTRYDEQNVHAQCRACNRFDEGNMNGYALNLIRRYGADILEILALRKSQTKKIDKFEFEILIKHYQKELKRLKDSQ